MYHWFKKNIIEYTTITSQSTHEIILNIGFVSFPVTVAAKKRIVTGIKDHAKIAGLMSLNFNKVEELTDMIVSTTSSLRRHLKSMLMASRDLRQLLRHQYAKEHDFFSYSI